MGRDPLRLQLRAFNLPLAHLLGEWTNQRRNELLAAKSTAPASAKEPPSASAKGRPSAAAAEHSYAYWPAAAAAWQGVLDGPTPARLAEALALMDKAQPLPAADAVELHFLRMLKEHLDPSVWDTAGSQIKEAVTARHLAELAATPAEPQVHYAIRALMEEADRHRRSAEDNLFVGTAEALAESGRIWPQLTGASGELATAISRGQKLGEAFQLRNRACAILPYLVQWRLARWHDADPKRLGDLIESCRQTSARLEEALDSGQWPAESQQAVARLQTLLKEQEDDFEQACEALKTTGSDKKALRAIAAVLAVPLVTGKQRNDLRKAYLDIAKASADASGGDRASVREDHGAAPAASAGAAQLNRLQQWKEHPVLTILRGAQFAAGGRDDRTKGDGVGSANRVGGPGDQTNPPQNGTSLEKQGEEVRSLLDALPAKANDGLQDTARCLREERSSPSPVATRHGRSQADRLLRTAASLGDGLWRGPAPDPARLLRTLDFHYLVLWHGQRTLEDFWGPAADGKLPFFQVVAADQWKSARELCEDDKVSESGESSLPQRLQERIHALRGIELETKDLSAGTGEKDGQHQVSVTLGESLPQGEAAVYLQAGVNGPHVPLTGIEKSREANFYRMGIPIAKAGTVSTPLYVITHGDRPGETSLLQAVLLYRGHVRSQPCAGDLNIVYSRVPEKTTITVHGKAQEGTSLEFILDCSGSMGKIVAHTGRTRLDIARDSLTKILTRLAAPGCAYRVGLLIYGHRVGWNPKNENQMVVPDPADPQRLVAAPPDLDIVPANDVEQVLAPRPFTHSELDKIIIPKLNSLRDLGETPLYLAILKAIGDLVADQQARQRHVVVITDGFNEQSGNGPWIKSAADVQQALAARPDIRLDIVGFNLDQDTAEKETLQTLVDQSHGGFYRTQDPAALLGALEKSLSLGRYVVETVPDQQRLSTPLELNTPCVIERVTGRTPLLIRLVDDPFVAPARVAIDGGEALRLSIRENPRRLVHQHYDTNLFDSESDKEGTCVVGAHMPVWQGSAARFDISVQNADPEQFSFRPAEAWIEIQPDAPAGHLGVSQPYVFYDLNFEPQRPGPVLGCLAPNWPAAAREAKVQLWWKYQKTPAQRISVESLRQRGLSRPDLPGVEFKVETASPRQTGGPYRVILTEQHPRDGEASDLYAVKVEMEPSPEMVLHSYNVEARRIRHIFDYKAMNAEVDQYQVLLTTRKELRDRAFSLPRPLHVRLPAQ